LPVDWAAPLWNGYHRLVRAQLEAGLRPLEFIAENRARLGDKVILADDIFCGLVPMDAAQRAWREETGRALALLAREAQEVVRVFCGLAARLK
jgi:adenosyl cobinamide kinase/adenosyl cobinamide phosphate guanylyltransferase